MNCKTLPRIGFLLLCTVAHASGSTFLMDGHVSGSTFNLSWESTPSEPYLVYDSANLRGTFQLRAYTFGTGGTNRTSYPLAAHSAGRPVFARVYKGADLLAVDNFVRADNPDVEMGHNVNKYTTNSYTEYNDASGYEVSISGQDMLFELTASGADDVTVVSSGGVMTNMVKGRRLDFTALLRPADAEQPSGAYWGMGLSYGTDEQWPASLLAVELEDNGTARFFWNGVLAATNHVPDADTRYVSLVFNNTTKRAAILVNGVEYFYAIDAAHDETQQPQLVMHASKPAGPPASFRVDRYLTAALRPAGQTIVAEMSVFNPLYFGADPTGQADSVPAFNEMFEMLGDSRHASLYIPPGDYRLASPLVVPAFGNTSQYGMQIAGAGEGVTRFLVDNTDGGIRFAGTLVSWMQLTLRDFSIIALQPGIEYAFYMDVPPSGVTQNRMLNLINLNVSSANPGDGNYFKTGYLVWNTWYPRFENIKVQAEGTASNGNWSCEVGLDMEDCYNPMIGDCVFSGVATGMVYAAPFSDPEDGKVINSRFEECSVGLWIDIDDPDSWAEPAFHVNNCDVSFRDYGIYVNGMRQLFFSHNSFQCLEQGTALNFSPTDIYLNYAYSAILDHNFFWGPSTTNRVGIKIQPDSGYVSILGNQFDMEGTEIENNSTHPVFMKNNMYGGFLP